MERTEQTALERPQQVGVNVETAVAQQVGRGDRDSESNTGFLMEV